MANPEHLAILKQGVEVWNNWRLESIGLTDLREHDNDILQAFASAFSSKKEVIIPDLSGADLRKANLNDAFLLLTNLSEANLSEANLIQANLYESYMVKANLQGANLTQINLDGSNLKQSNLIDSVLICASLINANLEEANLSNSDLMAACLGNANLSNANLSQTCLHDAFLNATNLTRANLSESDLSAADLSEADLSEANLNGANLYKTKLWSANLSKANLSNAYLEATIVCDTNFHAATLTGACITYWQINSETNLDGVICEYVYLDEGYVYDEEKTERRPIKGNFTPGEFASLYEKILENTDLILSKIPESENTLNKLEKNIDLENTSNNKGVHTWERLRFRSKPEIKIAQALDRAGVLFIPNSLARLNTTTGRGNKEPDFLICYNGKWGILEVDGPFHIAERRVEEQERERIFKNNGIKVVERFDSERCYNNPDEVVQEFFKMIEIGYS